MSRPPRRRTTLLTAAAVFAVAAGLYSSPGRVERPVRAAVLDVVVSAQSWALGRYDRWRPNSLAFYSRIGSWSRRIVEQPNPPSPNSDERVQSLLRDCRRLRIENARLRDELRLAEKYGPSPLPLPNAAAVQTPVVLRAALVNRETLAMWLSVRHLSEGRAHGVAESSLVLEDHLPHIDQGSEAGVEPELDVFTGRCVVGRIASVGRWTSTLELVTDPRYRALAQIVRPSEQGASFGTEGILIGQGTGSCKLNDVPTTQTVRVGDEVYTSDRDGRTGVPLYYGRIVPGVAEAGRHWDITVEPAVKTADLKSVIVLKLPPILGGSGMLAE